MIPVDLDEVAQLCPGRLERASGSSTATGVVIDSRRVVPGDLFVAVGIGERYADAALRAGASATLVPDDPLAALATLARTVRDRSSVRVVGITGSTGKTSTKDILAAICTSRARTVAAEASYNNELGVPLTLCRIDPDTEICVLELAMRGFGQITDLATMAGPDVGVITNVGPAHVELVGSLDGVVQAKGELIDALRAGATAIVPDTFPVERRDIDIVRVGDPEARLEDGRTLVRFEGREIAFTFRARHQARNALVALSAARALDVEADDLVQVELSRWRGQETVLAGDGLLINDAYNANPASMRAALDHLADCSEGRRLVVVLGEMAELGPNAPEYHRDVGRQIVEMGVEAIVAVGPLARHYLEPPGPPMERTWVSSADEAADVALAVVRPGDCVLVKASRAVGLERVAEALEAAAGGRGAP